ncbi:hypothetical protein CUMW_228430 [Citrus unshiu]|uniref:Uncharacterized protein n=1 Tax=Citrus unshiu TaxID=55188 RepID=A0A2H5QHT0_CITUN|nr:hypothetical protein CUMW_228430 [Citrus unshiu]
MKKVLLMLEGIVEISIPSNPTSFLGKLYMDIGSIYILIGVKILRLRAWSGSGSNLFTYTEIGF